MLAVGAPCEFSWACLAVPALLPQLVQESNHDSHWTSCGCLATSYCCHNWSSDAILAEQGVENITLPPKHNTVDMYSMINMFDSYHSTHGCHNGSGDAVHTSRCTPYPLPQQANF